MMTYNAKTAYKGSISSNYEDDRTVEKIWQTEHNWLKKALETFPNETRLLDIPVGTGRFLPLYQQKSCTVYGFDISGDMVQLALEKQDQMQTDYRLQIADAETIPLSNNAVDVIVCFRLFHLIPFGVIKQILREFYRVSASDAIIEVFDSSFRTTPRASIFQIARYQISRLVKGKTREIRADQILNSKPWATIQNFQFDKAEFNKAILKCGFQIKRIDRLDDAQNPATIYWLKK